MFQDEDPWFSRQVQGDSSPVQPKTGFFLILTSPERQLTPGVVAPATISEFNGDLQQDAQAMFEFFKTLNMGESLFSADHGIGECTVHNKLIHSKDQFWKQVQHFANLSNTPAEFEVVIFYCGHGLINTGDWVLFECRNNFIEFEEFMELWVDGMRKTSNIKKLTLIMDSCYSGCWVTKLKLESSLHSFPISIISAASDGDGAVDTAAAYAGKFFKWISDGKSPSPQRPMAWKTHSYGSSLFDKIFLDIQAMNLPSSQNWWQNLVPSVCSRCLFM